ncbi:hypothetical protein BDR07DRAFT_1431067 [Suillus spraguei]|nr:hypothetical protein BDR07DRAFT_1431067 [Suillus spraguei]
MASILSGGGDEKDLRILAITTARDACIAGDLATAEESLTQDIDTDADDYTLYAHRSFILARKYAWDLALDDAVKSISIQPSLTGSISKGIVLCGKGHAIALFNADQHEEALLLIKELAVACPNTDPLARRVVETYIRVQLGIKALDGSHHDEAADHFTAAVTSGAFSSKYIHQIYEDLTVLFGWDLESLCLTAHQKRCQAFLSAGKPDEALEAHKYMMDVIDEPTKASCLDWSNQFKEQCSALAEQNDRILGAEIPGQEQYGYDTEPDFFHGMHQHSQVSRPRPQQRPGRLKRLRFPMARAARAAPPPAPTTPPPVAAATTFKAQIRHLFTRSPHRATLPVIDVPFAKGKERNACADEDRSKDPNIVPDDGYLDTTQPDSNTRQQQQQEQEQPGSVQVDTGEHGGGRWCCCC